MIHETFHTPDGKLWHLCRTRKRQVCRECNRTIAPDHTGGRPAYRSEPGQLTLCRACGHQHAEKEEKTG